MNIISLLWKPQESTLCRITMVMLWAFEVRVVFLLLVYQPCEIICQKFIFNVHTCQQWETNQLYSQLVVHKNINRTFQEMIVVPIDDIDSNEEHFNMEKQYATIR